jgi:hypothetical protein
MIIQDFVNNFASNYNLLLQKLQDLNVVPL